jgi:hypothetical protein
VPLGDRAARRAFVREREEVKGDWRELHVVCGSPRGNRVIG